MRERTFRWYHYLMIPFQMQVAIVIVVLIFAGAQLMVYDLMQDDLVAFKGECQVTVGDTVMLDGVESKNPGAKMRCGGVPVNMGGLEAKFLYYALTTVDVPAIVCTKMVTEYLKEVTWKCEFEYKEEYGE